MATFFLIVLCALCSTFFWEKQTKFLSGILTVSEEESDQCLDSTFCHLLKDSTVQGPDSEDISTDDGDVTLIYARNKYFPPNDIGLGATLLVSPTTTSKRLKLSPVAEDNTSC